MSDSNTIPQSPNEPRMPARRSAIAEQKERPMWTEKRLLALYQRYSRRYWDGELTRYKIGIMKCRHCRGFTDDSSRTVVVDVDGHWNDDEIRLTLLHEMVHVAARDGESRSAIHGLRFWQEVDRILQKGAPADLVLPISPQLRRIFRVKAGGWGLYYCKKAVRKVEAARKRLRQWEEDSDLEGKYRKTIAQFQTLAPEVTWAQALVRIGPRTHLVDE